MSEIEWTIFEADRTKPYRSAVSVAVYDDSDKARVHVASWTQENMEVDYVEKEKRVGPYLTPSQITELIDVLKLVEKTLWSSNLEYGETPF